LPRTEIPVTLIDRNGAEPPAQIDSDEGNGMEIKGNSGKTFVEIVSTDAGSQSVGFAIAETVDGEAATDKTVVVPAGETVYAGPFPARTYNQPGADRSIYVNPSVDSTLKLRAYKLSSS
jgi:hypothetical protein